MDDTDQFGVTQKPTAIRPLLGLTVLVVEDSRFACDAMRLLCLRGGARIRRADCLRSARRHLQVYRPSVVIVDMGLPDGPGEDLIAELAVLSPRVSVLLATSGDEFAEGRAMAAGADGFLAKPISSVYAFQHAIISQLPAARRPRGPRAVHEESVTADPIAFRDDMVHAADVLVADADDWTLSYAAQFLYGVARSAGDGPLASAAQSLSEACATGDHVGSTVSRLSMMVQDRLAERMAI
ncbi:response regulator [Puniceibacterium sp. IMCC21224]|uniref:response regulator n=1 Tax=Puniceibacterium sp. IMCC21224 TaxID=1618204 RepID=UPI00064D8951|nr:response regulator [Puniceibacterium sp. IMCC21224]KMK65795.1 Response regulator receiver domain protein [Puniceibacterium sp. IMCC21224]